jgi:hypothetical protein
MTAETAALAILLRRTQWLLDDLAYEVGAGVVDEADLCAAASALDETSRLLRERTPSRDSGG